MADVVSPEVRSRMMAGIRSKDTKPEMMIRKGLHARGFRYRLHSAGLPGKPDLVFPRYNAVIFVHGCFWHGHECHLFKAPSSREDFWKQKIARNRSVDLDVRSELLAAGWRIGIVWECAIKGRYRHALHEIIGECATWLRSSTAILELRGQT